MIASSTPLIQSSFLGVRVRGEMDARTHFEVRSDCRQIERCSTMRAFELRAIRLKKVD